MAIAVLFQPVSMSVAQYGEVHERLNQAGFGEFPGRLSHVSFGDPDHLHVLDIYEDEAAFQTFGQTLMPILAELGIDPGEPQVEPVHLRIPE